VSCSVLQCVDESRRLRMCSSVVQCVAKFCRVLQLVAACCSVVQCVAVCCSELKCVAKCSR